MALKTLIPFADYVRIYTTIYSVLKSEQAHIHRACKFFAHVGAAILRKHYKLDAIPVSGGALYCFDSPPAPKMFYGRAENGAFVSDLDAFHCWIQCQGYLIDFHAPLTRDVQAEEGRAVKAPRKMMQKPLALEVAEPEQACSPGDFFLLPNPDLTKRFQNEFAQVGLANDLGNICLDWYRKPPRNMQPRITTIDKHGEPVRVKFEAPGLDGVW